ncbi:MAG: phosphoribosyltransferase family protein [Candidatus Taylorbacteria bacterium]
MQFFRLLYSTFQDALFPLSEAERGLFSYSPEKAFEVLPKASLTPKMIDPTGSETYHQTLGIFAYKDERVSRLVWNIKYKKSKPATKIAGYALRKVISALLCPDGIIDTLKTIVIVPMPITQRRRRERGYNQCELITEEMAHYVNKDIQIIFENKLLLRIQHTSHQKHKDREARLELEGGIFKVDEKILNEIKGKIVGVLEGTQFIIVDDVITTGTTIRGAIETMKKAGLTNVRGVALAH